MTINIGEMQRLLSCKAEREPNHRFDDLYGLLCDMDWLWLAHEYVAQNSGSKTAGCDGMNMAAFAQDTEGNLRRLRASLRSETFVACPVRRVFIPKAHGKFRPLGIPSIRDRIVQEAIRMVLEPIYEADFRQSSFGFRPNRCTMDAIRYITCCTTESKKFFWAVEGDISAYFDTIHHRRLVKLLRRRVADERLLDLIWKFLRSGVMERKLFQDTESGVPQGGIVSPLLANVYLHELDKYMEQYTILPRKVKQWRRRHGLANYAYVRYADDFVVLCNGTREHAESMREELQVFLSSALRLTLSLEKTKVTHVNDGFDFLGFTIHRCVGSRGVGTKVLIPAKGIQRHLDNIQAALASGTQADSVRSKILAVNRIIAGWCRYYQYTSKASTQFGELEYRTYWKFAHWLARKHKRNIPETLQRFGQGSGLGIEKLRLLRHTRFHTRRTRKRIKKPNPYTTREALHREELLDLSPLSGHEERPGMMDLRPQVLQRDNYRCRLCGIEVTSSSCEVDHIRPVHCFKRPIDANGVDNLCTLCISCHLKKTERDRRRESRMR